MLCYWACGKFYYSPKKGAILKSVQNIYGKKPLKMLKAAVTRWLTHGRSSKRVLDCFRELMETIDQICLNTAESEARSYRALLTNHKVLFCICFMTDVLSIMNTLSLILQMEGALLVDIQCSVDLTLDKFCKLAEADSPDKYTEHFGANKKLLCSLPRIY